jgi:hypothetical protein
MSEIIRGCHVEVGDLPQPKKELTQCSSMKEKERAWNPKYSYHLYSV